MYYPAGSNRSVMIILLVAYIVQVVSATPVGKQEFLGTQPIPPPPAINSSTSPVQFLDAARRAAASLLRDTARVSDKVLWSTGKMLLSAGETVNYVWDATLQASVRLLRAGAAACSSIAGRLAHVPVIGFGATGVNEAVSVAVDAAAKNAAHDTLVRSQALATLNAKLNESGARLRPAVGPAATATDPRRPAAFFPRD
ncbi:uncharacterized protein LOC112591358 isoform X3 [Melanaphis sacchari]|uniref:uncharacterized protein LOC112591358 isoform X3 n=1 Tax=Melanaphis sacchari TaxID=742174 RepID=UPI000DC13224|nr:uncharacterized protein LOC112591358 isoform X3 [Melanaphis sacchari]